MLLSQSILHFGSCWTCRSTPWRMPESSAMQKMVWLHLCRSISSLTSILIGGLERRRLVDEKKSYIDAVKCLHSHPFKTGIVDSLWWIPGYLYWHVFRYPLCGIPSFSFPCRPVSGEYVGGNFFLGMGSSWSHTRTHCGMNVIMKAHNGMFFFCSRGCERNWLAWTATRIGL